MIAPRNGRWSRRADWPTRLAVWHAHQLSAPPVFAWGRCDCVLWAGGWVEEATGQPLVEGLVGNYDDIKGARRELKRHLRAQFLRPARGQAFPALLSDVVELHLQRRVGVLEAQRGDLVLVSAAAALGNACLGVCIGSRALCLGAVRGTAEIALADARRAWRV